MRIWIDTTELTSSDAKQWPSDLRFNGRAVTQEGQFLRSAQARMFARSNLKTSIGFKIEREHTSIQSCQVFMFTHYIALPLSGTVKFQSQSSAGSKRLFYLANAAVEVVDFHQIGLRSIHEYSVSGGKPTLEEPS